MNDRETLERYLANNPNASAMSAVATLRLDPAEWLPVAEALTDDRDDEQGSVGATPVENTDADDASDSGVSDRSTGTAEDTDTNTPAAVRAHYDREDVEELYRTLGVLETGDGDLYALGNHDFTGWYTTSTRRVDIPPGFDGAGRPFALGREYDDVREHLDRTLYATVNYAPTGFFVDGWWPYRFGDDGREWQGDETPTPGYGDLGAYAPFADIDLADEVKRRRPDGEGSIHRGAVEAALAEYVDAFAELVGSREAVFALDSVGGAYVMAAPTTTAPIVEAFADDRDARSRVLDELTDRLNEWLESVADDVLDVVPAAEGVFEPDAVNHKNRLYKAPMSVHSSLDGVVRPMDTDAPEYEYLPLADVDADDVAEATEWADRFTDDHSGCIGALVETLWPEYTTEADGWRDALTAWVADECEAEERREAKQREREQAVKEAVAERDPDAPRASLDVVTAAAERLDVTDVIREACRREGGEWNTAPGRSPTRFAAPWHREHNTGTACFADPDKFVDQSEGGAGGGAIKAAAVACGYVDVTKSPRGEDFRNAVAKLRSWGFDVPLLERGRSAKVTPEELGFDEESEDEDEELEQFAAALEADRRNLL